MSSLNESISVILVLSEWQHKQLFLEGEGKIWSGIFTMTSSICPSLVSAETLFFLSDFLYKFLLDLARCRDFLNSWMHWAPSLLFQGNPAAGLLLPHPAGAWHPISPSASIAASWVDMGIFFHCDSNGIIKHFLWEGVWSSECVEDLLALDQGGHTSLPPSAALLGSCLIPVSVSALHSCLCQRFKSCIFSGWVCYGSVVILPLNLWFLS